MEPRKPWLGWCHLHRMETSEDFETHAAVLCENREAFDHVLRDHAQSLGLILMWTQDVRPAMEWLKVNPKFIGLGGDLARAVHPGHKVELGQLTAMENPNAKAEKHDYLLIEEIRDLEPLDRQWGVWPEKTVPDKLSGPLFGDVEPTEAEIEAYGGIEAVPPMKTYIVLDAAKLQFGFSEIEDCGMPFRCLFKGKAASNLKDAAPYLIELDHENRFIQRLFKYVPEMPDRMTTVHVWHKEPGIYARSRVGFDTLWKHLRKFPRQQDQNGKWVFFRFWEPRVLRDYLDSIRQEPRKIMNWFGRRAAALTLITISGGVLHSHALAESIPDNQKQAPLQVDCDVQARLHAKRVMAEFAKEQGIPFDWDTYDVYDYPWQDFETEDLKIIVLLHGHFGITEKYPPEGMNPGSGCRDDPRKRDILDRLMFYKAQGVPYGL